MPMFCSSLPHYETTLVFGRTLLKAIFHSESNKLLDRCQADKDKFTDEQKVLFKHLPKSEFLIDCSTSLVFHLFTHSVLNRFLSMFEEDITAPNSPIWDVDFKKSLPCHLYSGFDKRVF